MSLGYGATIVRDGLVLHLDAANQKSYSGSGTTWHDLSKNKLDGSLVNGPTYGTTYKGEFSIDGSNDEVSISTGYTGSEWTLLLWNSNIGPTSFSTVGHRTYVCSNTFRFQWDDTGSTSIARGPFIDFTSAVGGGQANYKTGLGPSTFFNTWYMAGVVASSSSVKTTYNDITTGQSSVIGSSRQFSTNGDIKIGVDNLSGIGGTDRLNRDGGSVYVSNIMLYNRALTDEEVKQNFNAHRGRYGL